MQKTELENPEFIENLNETDKDIVFKALDLYYDYVDYKRAKEISQAIESGKMKTYPADEVYKGLGI